MYQTLQLMAIRWLPRGSWYMGRESDTTTERRPFTTLRCVVILGLLSTVVTSLVIGATLSHFLVQEILQRDALLTSQFVGSVVTVQNQEARLGPKITLGQILDERTNMVPLAVDPKEAARIRREFYDHIKCLPDVLLAKAYGVDRKIIWSTNPALIGKLDEGNDELDRAFKTRAMVTVNYFDQEAIAREQHKSENAFTILPTKFFVESYMPLLNGNNEVVAVLEIYKAPESLLAVVQRCRQLVWICTGLGMIVLYLAMSWIIRRADQTMDEQQRRLVDSEALCVIGEMSAAVAHGIRNPLAAMRSSAELALEGDPESIRKNAQDIIFQVDRLGTWVRDLLVFSRPMAGELQVMDMVALIDECLPNFTTQLEKNRITCHYVRPAGAVPRVRGNRVLATQTLASVIANAIEAMPNGGVLNLELAVAEREHRVSVVISDTGKGMSPTQMDLVFKPFRTTKRNGLGLGMALVKRIMERFDGTVRLDSAEGQGTRVSLNFGTIVTCA